MTKRCDQCEAWDPIVASETNSGLCRLGRAQLDLRTQEWGRARMHPRSYFECRNGYWPRVKADDWCCEFEPKDEDRHLLLFTHTYDDEERALADLVMRFAEAMLVKLLAKKRTGWRGWQHDKAESLWPKMNTCAAKWSASRNDVSQLVDVANFCAFIWNLPVKAKP